MKENKWFVPFWSYTQWKQYTKDKKRLEKQLKNSLKNAKRNH